MAQRICRAVVCALALATSAGAAGAQSLNVNPGGRGAPRPAGLPSKGKRHGSSANPLSDAGEVERRLREQQEEIERLRSMLEEQARAVGELRSRVERAERAWADAPRPAFARAAADNAGQPPGAARPATVVGDEPSAAAPAAALTHPERTDSAAPAESGRAAAGKAQAAQGGKTAEAAAKALNSIAFSGEVRLRYESFYRQQNALPSADVPGAIGNPLSTRQRLRIRARLAARGRIGEQFEWGLRLTTGTYPDVVSANQTLTDFFSHKSVTLDRAFITYRPSALPGFEFQGGKFETPWWRTELTWDNDLSPEGLHERYAYRPKKSKVRELALVAWQLPFLERNSAFVLGADGRVDVEASRRGGRDLALYGGQARAEIAPTDDSLLRLAVTDNFFSGTQFINPAQHFGPVVQLPVTVTIPAAGTTPARTVAGTASVPRELLVGGNSNLGVSRVTTNALNRDGRLASGFNLLELYGQLELNRRGRWPLQTIIHYVKNTRAHDFFAAGPGGADLLVENDEDQGVWAEFQVGRDVLRRRPEEVTRGDVLFNYTFARIEKDAVLTPFNFSNFDPPSDVRAHRFVAAYALDPRVALSLTTILTQRPNGPLGPFLVTPPGSLNRTLTRLQLDTIFRF